MSDPERDILLLMRRAVLLVFWLAIDLLLFDAAYLAAYLLRVGTFVSTDLPLTQFLGVVTFVGPLWLLALVTTRTFGLTRSQGTTRNAVYIAYACAMGAALVALSYYFVYARVFSRLILAMGLVSSTVLIWGWHLLVERIVRRSLAADPPAHPTLVVGVTRESRELIALLKRTKNPLTPVAILDGFGAKENDIGGVPVLGKLNHLEEILTEKKITHLIQCSDVEQSINLLGACRARGITYLLLPSVLGIVERDERIESLEDRSVVVVSPKRVGPLDWFFR